MRTWKPTSLLGAGDAAAAADADRSAAQHMRMLGDPLGEAIVATQPESFR